jgi:hypothetical protein
MARMMSVDDMAVLIGNMADDVARMTECTASDMAVDVATDVDESETDTWHSAISWKGATWPNHGLPCGTPIFFNIGCVKILWSPGDSNPGPPLHITTSQSPFDRRTYGYDLIFE